MKEIFFKYLKLFVSAFLGVLLPELCVIFQNGLPVDLNAFIVVLIPAVCAAFSAGFAALGNYAKSFFKN